MKQREVHSETSHQEQWLALLDRYGVGHPKALQVIEAPGILVQTTRGEPPGAIGLEGTPANVLMVNLSPVQALRQTRGGRSFVSNMLHGDMTLMPCGIPSEWSWNSTCDRMDVIISPDVFGEGRKLEVVNRFLFRDCHIETICRRLSQQVSLNGRADRLYVESMAIDVAALLLRCHSTACESAKILPRGGLTRNQARRVLEYIEANLGRETTVRELAGIADLSPHHFVRMFKRSIGMTPYRYVLERRVEWAKKMIETNVSNLVEIGVSLGFCSQSHFTTTFHRIVGATPAEFRRCCGR